MTLVAEQPSTLSLSADGQARSTIQGLTAESRTYRENVDAHRASVQVPGARDDLSPGQSFTERACLSRSTSRTGCSGIGDRASVWRSCTFI